MRPYTTRIFATTFFALLFLWTLAPFAVAYGGTVQLPQTGQSQCYDSSGAAIACAGTGQDGETRTGVPWPSPRFLDNGDGTITDKLTGLMWLKDANCAHTIGHDPLGIGNGELGWVDALAFVAGINNGTYNISACASYTNHYSNWHLPNSNELASIINYSVPDNSAWLNSAGFTNVMPDYYLSSTTRMFEMTGAPLVGPILVGMRSGGNWGGGFVNYLEESPSNPWAGHYTWPVRVDELVAGTAPVWKTGQTTCYDGMISLGWKVVDCAGTGQDGDIRSGIEWPAPRFKDNADGTVTDYLTGLMWTKSPTVLGSLNLNWQDTLNLVKDMNAGLRENFGYTDWRLSNIVELNSLVSRQSVTQVLPEGHPFYGYDVATWASTTLAGQTQNAWLTEFFWGLRIPYYDKSGANPAGALGWPVRGGSLSPPPPLVDTDGDGMPDAFEIANGFNPNDPGDAGFDKDNDGLTNLQEFQIGTKPKIQDTDGDGVDDGVEKKRETNPLDPNSRPTPSVPEGLNVQWGKVVPGLLNVTLGWQHPGFRTDGHNAEGVNKFVLYRRKLLPDIDCHFNGFFYLDCQVSAVYDLVGETPADRLGAVFTNLEDLVDVLDGWQFAVSAVNQFGEESGKSADVVVVPFKDSETLRIKPPTEPILFVHGIAGNSETWAGAANTLNTLYKWTEGELSFGYPILIQPGDFYRFTFPDPLGPIDEQGVHIGKLLNAISPNKKAIIVAHSQGGLASRYYLQVIQKGQTNRVSRLVTYGTPHQGSNLIAVGTSVNSTLNLLTDLTAFNLDVDIPLFGHFGQFDPLSFLRDGVQGAVNFVGSDVNINSDSACDLNSACSDFISTVSNFVDNPLPDPNTAGIVYVSLQGRVAILTDAITGAARLTGNSTVITLANGINALIRDTDLIVSRENQDLSQVPNINFDGKQIKVFLRDPVNHFVMPKFKEGDDYIGVLMGLGYPVLSIQVHSPVTVAVVDPNGHFIAPQVNNLPGATYTFTGGVEIPLPIAGDYKIIVIPDPSASPTETYTLEVTLDGKTTVLAQDQQIKDIPPQGFLVPVSPPNEVPTANAGTDQTVHVGSLVTLNGSGSVDPDNGPSPLSFAWSKISGPTVSLASATTAKPTFTPSTIGAYTFDLVVNDGETSSAVDSVAISIVYNFTGFFSPVDNLPIQNEVKAGSAVPVKFSLAGNRGLGILATGYPKTQSIACSSSAPGDAIEETVTAGNSGLSYDASIDQYKYVLNTAKSWKGTCRQLIVKLNDGTEHKANFIFK